MAKTGGAIELTPQIRDSPLEEEPAEIIMESMSNSIWGDMMREAVDREEA